MRKTLARALSIAALAGSALAASGCVTTLKKTAYQTLDTTVALESLDKDQYKVLGEIEALGDNRDAQRQGWLGGNLFGSAMLPFVGKNATREDIQRAMMEQQRGGFAALAMGAAISNALYNAMQAHPDADALINIKVIKGEDFWFWIPYPPIPIHHVTVKVRATAIKIKEG